MSGSVIENCDFNIHIGTVEDLQTLMESIYHNSLALEKNTSTLMECTRFFSSKNISAISIDSEKVTISGTRE